MGKNVFIGPRGAEQWIKAPAPRTAFQAVGWAETIQGRNGILTGRQSRNTHMTYELSWPIVPTELARTVEDWFYGVRGDGLIHWLDPMLQNHLPARWSYPALGVTDGPPIYGNTRPTAVNTAANSKNLPTRSARYTLESSATLRQVYIPVPPDHAAHIGIHAADAAAAASIVSYRRYNGATMLGQGLLPAIAASDNTRYSTVIGGSTNMTGITLQITPGISVGGTTLPSSGDIAGMMVEILPKGQLPQGSGFVRGGGANGCRMFNPPTTSPISAYRDRTSLSALLEEVGE